MPDADYEVASEEDVWVLHWRLLSGAQEAASTVIQDRQPEANGKEALAASQGLSTSTTPAQSSATEAADCSDVGTSSPDGSDKISIDSKPDAGFGLSEDTHTDKETPSTDAGETASARSSVASSSSSADSCATSANGRSKTEQTPSTSKQPWLRQGTPSTGTELSQEVTDNDECESSDADSRGTRSTQTSLEEILDTSLNAEGAVYSRESLLLLRPGGAPCAAPPAAARPRATPSEQQTAPGPGPPRVAARPPAARPTHAARQQRGPAAPSVVSPSALDDHATAVAASILQAELVLEALLSEEPTSASESATGAALLPGATAATGGRPALTTLMLRNIPNRSTRISLQRQLDQMGFKGEYDLVYVPVDRTNKNNSLGYAFINFRSATSSSRFAARFHGAPARELFPESSTGKVLGVCYAEVQGREAYMERSSCPGPPRFLGFADEADGANRSRFVLAPEGWALRETWAPWPWVLHANQRISIVDSLPAPACAWLPAALPLRTPQPRIPRGRGALLTAVEVAGSRVRGGLGLCAEAPEFVPTLLHPEMGCNAAAEMQMHGEAFDIPSPYGVEVPMLRYHPHAEVPPSVLLPSAQWPVPGVLLPSAQWPVQGDMTTCSFWDSVETPMNVGHGACYDSHEPPTAAACGHWAYADYGAALA